MRETSTKCEECDNPKLGRYLCLDCMERKGGEIRMKEEILKLIGLQDTLRDIEKTKLFNHVPFEEYAQTIERLFDWVDKQN